jgi:thioredoxin reductase
MIDVIIIGGSFGGLSAAIQLARARRGVLIIDSGKPRNRFSPASHGFLGQDGKNYATILNECMRQIRKYPTVSIVKSEVQGISKRSNQFEVTLKEGGTKTCLHIILATGLKDKLPSIPGLKERWGNTVLHCPYCHGYEIDGQPIGVLANHSMSTQQAILISDWAPTVFFTQGIFKPTPTQEQIFKERKIEIEQSPIIELVGSESDIKYVILADGRKINLAAIFISTVYQMASSLAEQIGCEFVETPFGRVIKVDEWKQTSIKGIFAAGDIVQPMHSAILASASGAIAGVGAHHSLIHNTRIYHANQ